MNLEELFWLGIQADRKQHEEKEESKIGTLRAGDSGVMLPTGDIIGSCHRRSYVRSFLGIESEPPEQSNLLMFELGKANEVIWEDKLRKSWPGTIKKEEEIPTRWTTANNTPVTGRPDMVLCDAAGNPKIGIEHKAICSLWTARDVSFEMVPKTKHLFQAAHYAWQLNIPYHIVYSQYTNYAIPDWAYKMFPAGHPLVEVSDKGKPKHVKPHLSIFEVAFSREKRIMFRGGNQWITTPWGIPDIERFYNFIEGLKDRQVLGPRPVNYKANGKAGSYSDCDYCPLQQICDNHENQWEKWNDEVQRHFGKR